MKLIGLGPELNLTEKDSGLDLTTINMSDILEQEDVPERETTVDEDDGLENIDMIINGDDLIIEEPAYVPVETPVDEEELDGVGGPVPPTITEKMSLEEIQEELIRITIELEQIIEEVQILINNNSL